MEKWTKDEIEGFSKMLDDYTDRLCNDGCNDLNKSEKKLADIINIGKDEDNKISTNWQLLDYFKNKIKEVPLSSQASSDESQALKIKALEFQVKELTNKNLDLTKQVLQFDKVRNMINHIKQFKG